MRIIIFGLLLVLAGCTKEEERILIPSAPSDLMGAALATEINLFWKDNSINENGFRIERKMPKGNYAVVAVITNNIQSYIDKNLEPDTVYSYRITAFNDGGNSAYSNELILRTSIIEIPKLVTIIPSYIANTRACSGGLISNDGGGNITQRGIVWNTSPNPTTALNTKTRDGSKSGLFESYITDLAPNTTYYIRAYASNSAGTSYGNEESFTTLNEPAAVLPSITIGTQTWTTKNLEITTYSDGTAIPQIGWRDTNKWANTATGAWCYYTSDTGSAYGKLYNWYAVAGIYDEASKADVSKRKKLAPAGWHIPSDAEWDILIQFLGGENTAGGKMKEAGISFWNSPNTNATNSSGFAALPGGVRYHYADYSRIGQDGFWWSSSLYGSIAWYRSLNYHDGHVNRDYANKELGFSVRCIKD